MQENLKELNLIKRHMILYDCKDLAFKIVPQISFWELRDIIKEFYVRNLMRNENNREGEGIV